MDVVVTVIQCGNVEVRIHDVAAIAPTLQAIYACESTRSTLSAIPDVGSSKAQTLLLADLIPAQDLSNVCARDDDWDSFVLDDMHETFLEYMNKVESSSVKTYAELNLPPCPLGNAPDVPKSTSTLTVDPHI